MVITLSFHSDNLCSEGPCLRVGVFLPKEFHQAHAERGKPTDQVCLVPALIDTGARMTMLHPDIIRALNLPIAMERLSVRAANHAPEKCSVYWAELVLYNGKSQLQMPKTPVLSGHPADPTVMCLLGRDVLAHVVFTYNGPTGDFALEFSKEGG